MNIKQFTADSLAWVALGIFDRLDSQGRTASATNLVSLWSETGLRQADLIQGVVVLVREGYLSTEDNDGGPQFNLTDAGRTYIADRRARETADVAEMIATVRRQLRECRDGVFPVADGERRAGFC